MAEYAQIEETFAPEVFDLMTAWILERFGDARYPDPPMERSHRPLARSGSESRFEPGDPRSSPGHFQRVSPTPTPELARAGARSPSGHP
jgi:hypothetical protein